MSGRQDDLFGASLDTAPRASDEIVAAIRTRLHATLALVRSATAMPWPDTLAMIREDNAFRFGKDALPPEEGAALWAAFDAEMNRLYAIMNQDRSADGLD